MKENLLTIVNHYGVKNQQKKLAEEVFELNEAILEYRYDENKIYSEVEQHLKNHIIEEIADVMVILSQFKEYYQIDSIDILDVMKKKINRQIKRIENE